MRKKSNIIMVFLLGYSIFFKLEQMDLSVKESDVSVRAKLHNRVASYRAELHRLAKEFARAKCTVNIDLGIPIT